ncbi:MAG: ATP-binding protein [Dehalococcoidia bacterium]
MWKFEGQDHIYKLIQNSMSKTRINHAYLLLGPEHIGKSTLSLEITKFIHCSEKSKPCQKCPQCLRVNEKTHPDVVLVGNTIGEVRDIQEQVSLSPFFSTSKTFIILNGENLTIEASNALLKILEEPPNNVTFLICATDEQYLPTTIVSRCQNLELYPLPVERIHDYLIRYFDISNDEGKEEAKLISKLSKGRLGWAITAYTDTNFLQTRNHDISLFNDIVNGDMADRFLLSQQLSNNFNKNKNSIFTTLETWLGYLRDVMLIKTNSKELIVNIDYEEKLIELGNKFELKKIIESIKVIDKASKNLNKNGNPRITLDNLLIQFP